MQHRCTILYEWLGEEKREVDIFLYVDSNTPKYEVHYALISAAKNYLYDKYGNRFEKDGRFVQVIE